MTNFSFLKDWLDHPNPRPVVLECVPSRSGMSLSVYDREKLLYRINGCGFDRLGCALAEFLERLYQPELSRANFKCEEAEGRNLPGLHQARDYSVTLQGEIGLDSMREVASAIGLSVQPHETRNATLLIIQKAR